MLKLITLGGLSVRRDDGPLAGAATQRRRLALLALLARAGERGLSRDKLLGYLWPESEPDKGRNVLAQALYALRRDLGAEELFLGTTDLRLNAAVMSCDAGEFEAAVSAGRLQDAVSLYGGPFLDGIYIGDAPEFERWVETERTGLAHDYAAALERLASQASTTGDHRGAAAWWRKLAAADPLSTRVAVGLMRSLAASGDRASAIQHARVYEALLRQELDAAPDPEVLRVVEDLRKDPAPPSAAPPGERPSPALPAPSLVAPPDESNALNSAPLPTSDPHPRARKGRRWPLLAGLALVLVGLALAARAWWSPSPAPGGERRMIAVLPFRNLGKPEDEYFADGLTEEVISRLTGIRGLGVISRSSSMQYKESAKPLRQVGLELGAAYVLEGSVRWERRSDGTSRVRVTPQLIQVADDSYLWAERYDADLAEVFEVQGRIAERVASALHVQLGGAEREALATKPTENLDAYDAYLRAGILMDRAWGDVSALRETVEAYERAVELDPAFADAWARLAVAHTLAYRRGVDATPARLARAKSAADTAFALRRNLPAGHLAMGFYHYWGHREYADARREFLAVLDGRPSDTDALYGLGAVERREGRWPDAVTHLCLAADQDPRSVSKAWDCALAYFFTRDYPAAERYLDRAIRLDPAFAFSHTTRARIQLAWRGDTAAARRILANARQHADPATTAAGLLDTPFLLAGPEWDSALARVSMREFENNPIDYFFWRGSWHHARGEVAKERAAWDSLRAAAAAAIASDPRTEEPYVGLAMASAGLGRTADALHAIARAESILPLSRDAAWGADRAVFFAQIYTRLGETDRAIRQLEQLLAIASPLSPAWLAVDPAYKPLRGDPRFQALLQPR